jgi:hypothetical protein
MGHVAHCNGPFVVIEHYFDTSNVESSKVPTARRYDNCEEVTIIAYFRAVGCQCDMKSFTAINCLCL